MGAEQTITNYVTYAYKQLQKTGTADDTSRVLIVEDDPFSRKLFSKILKSNYQNIQLITSSSYQDAITALNKYKQFDLVVLDIYLGSDGSGIDFYLQLLYSDPKPVVIMTSALEQEEYLKLFPEGVTAPPFLKKPFRPEHCIDLVEIFTDGELR